MKNLRYENEIGGISGVYPDSSENAGKTLYIGTSGDLYDMCIAGEFGAITPYVAPPIDIGAIRSRMAVTRFQALAAMHGAGILTQVQTIIDNPLTDPLVKLAWDNALEFKRTSPAILQLAQTLGLTDEQLDTLFTTAKGIEV